MPYQSYIATNASSKTPGSSLVILVHFLWFAPVGATDKWMQRSKQNQPKTFPVKENHHTIKSAGVHAFPPHSFLFKAFTSYPCVSYLFSFTPVESPPFDTSPGDIKEATLKDAAMCLTQGHRGCNGRQVNVPPCSNKLWVTQIRTSPLPLVLWRHKTYKPDTHVEML